jgi:hypothetical protein
MPPLLHPLLRGTASFYKRKRVVICPSCKAYLRAAKHGGVRL